MDRFAGPHERMICCKTICIFPLGCFFCAHTALLGSRSRTLSHATGFPSNACDTVLVRRRQPAATPASRGSTWRSETIEKSRWRLYFFYSQMLASERLQERSSDVSAERRRVQRQAGLQNLQSNLFFKVLVSCCCHFKLRPPPTVLISLCVVPNQTAIVAFKYIQMPRFFFPNSLQSVQV